MKRIVLIYFLILACLFGVLSVLDRGSRYDIEKKIWKIHKQKLDVTKDPEAVPERKFENIIGEYRALIRTYPDSILIPGLYIAIGDVHALRRDYERAREVFGEIPELYPDDRDLLAKALFKVGETYEVSGNWAKAQEIYQKTIVEYSLTSTGLSLPIYIASYHRRKGDSQRMVVAYEKAVERYAAIAERQENTSVGLGAMRYLAGCYLEQDRWFDAIKILSRILEVYSTSDHLTVKEADQIIKMINRTAAYRLKDYDVAISLYEEIIEDYPGHPLEDYLKKVIDAFNQLKEKNIQVSDGK